MQVIYISLLAIIMLASCSRAKHNEPVAQTATRENTVAATPTPTDSAAVMFIHSFYEAYFHSWLTNRTDSVVQRYCTPALVKYLATSDRDYDEFFNAQDVDDDLLEQLTITKAPGDNPYYIVSYPGYQESTVHVVLTLMSVEDGYRISDIEGRVVAELR